MIERAQRALAWWFQPEWAGGWLAARWLWVLAAVLQYGFDFTAIPDVWGASDMVFVSGPYRLAGYIFLSPGASYGLWALSMLGIGMVAYGGKALRPGLVLWAVCAWTLLGYEALNVKAHDRLLAWLSLVLFASPAWERGLENKFRSPFARYFGMVVMASIYGSTGWNKALYEPTWWTDGSVLALHFLHPEHGSLPLGIWLSGLTALHPLMSVATVLWESSFPLLIWIKRLNPWVLAVGLVFHGLLLLTMNLGPFAFVCFVAYPVMLHPELARSLWLRWRG